MIEKLTRDQEALLPVYRDRWLEIGLSCEPLDLEKAKEAVKKIYAAANLKAPKQFYVFDSPMSAAMGAAVLKQNQVRDQVWDQVRNQVGNQVGNQVWDQVRNQVGNQVRNQVGNQVWDQVRGQVWDQVRGQVWGQVYGAHDDGWLSFYNYFIEVCGLNSCEPLQGLMDLARVCGWWAPYENAVIFQHRHCELYRDDEHRLHCETGPAVLYRDGFSIYAWHGVVIPGEWINGKLPTANEAVAWPNMEQRNAACELIGWHHILKELNAKLIDKDDDKTIGELYEVDLPDHGKAKFIKVFDPCASRTHAIRTDDHVKTALEGNALTWGLTPEEYRPEVQT